MHIAIDALGHRSGGGARVLLDLLNATRRHDHAQRVTVFAPPRAARDFDIDEDETVRVREMERADGNLLYRAWWLQYRWGQACHRVGADVGISLGGMAVERGVPTAVFIQQPLPFYPEARRRFSVRMQIRLLVIKALMRRACAAGSLVMVQTPEMRARVTEEFGLAPHEVEWFMSVPSLAQADPHAPALEVMQATPQGKRLLYCGSSQAHKNVDMLVDAMPALRERIPGAELFLTWPVDDPAGRREGVTCLGWLRPEEAAAVYRAATVVCLPAIAETVGLPQLEAMLAGTPLLVADRPYAHSVSGDAAAFFDPLEASDFVDRAAELLSNPSKRRELASRGSARAAELAEGDPYARLLDALAQLPAAAATPRPGAT